MTANATKYTKIADGLAIRNVTKEDSGEYTCKAFQIWAAMINVKEQTIRLNIQRKLGPRGPSGTRSQCVQRESINIPDKPISQGRRESVDVQYSYLKGNVNISCEAEAEPPATFTWYRDKKRLKPQEHQISTSNHESVLQVRCRFSLSVSLGRSLRDLTR